MPAGRADPVRQLDLATVVAFRRPGAAKGIVSAPLVATGFGMSSFGIRHDLAFLERWQLGATKLLSMLCL